MTEERTWRRFTATAAVFAGLALVVGLALSYGSVYRASYHAGFDTIWWQHGGRQVRAAHLFPLTLDVPVLVGYAGTIALTGRRSVVWARFVLWSCGAATVAAQVADGAEWVTGHGWVRAVIHGWPPALAVLTAHLFVKIVQALGFLVPPAAEPVRPSWVARSWAWVVRARADVQAASHDPTPDPTPDRVTGRVTDHASERVSEPSGDPVNERSRDRVNQQVTGRVSRSGDGVVTPMRRGGQPTLDDVVPEVLAGRMTKAEAARRTGKSVSTVKRRCEAVEPPAREVTR